MKLLTMSANNNSKDNNNGASSTGMKTAKTIGLGVLAFYLAGVPLAGYLSWSCNRAHGFGKGSSSIFAIIAGLFSWSYVTNYVVYKSYTCDITHQKCQLAGLVKE